MCVCVCVRARARALTLFLLNSIIYSINISADNQWVIFEHPVIVKFITYRWTMSVQDYTL